MMQALSTGAQSTHLGQTDRLRRLALWKKSDMSGRNVFYAQSGGVTSVINASAWGLIQGAALAPTPLAKSTQDAKAFWVL